MVYILEGMFNALISFTKVMTDIFSQTFEIDITKMSSTVINAVNGLLWIFNNSIGAIVGSNIAPLEIGETIIQISTIQILGGGLLVAVITVSIIKALNPLA